MKAMLDLKKLLLVSHIAETYADDIKQHRIEWERYFMDLMKYYRKERDKDKVSEPVDGEFGSGSSYCGKSHENSVMDDEMDTSSSPIPPGIP